MEEQQIITVINNIFNGTDKHDWELVRGSFAYEVFLDYFSMNKQAGSKLKASEVVERWRSFLTKFNFTLHFISNQHIAIDTEVENVATAFCKGQALHHLPNADGGDLWTVFGTYDFKLSKSGPRWMVTSMIFNLLYEQGNENLPALALESVE